MSENTTTGGLVEELRALHVRVETPMFGGDERSCRGCGQDWPCDTTSLLDAHASRTTEAACTDPRCQHGVPGACASAPAGLLGYMWQPDRAESVSSLASSSPKPGAVGVLARLIAGLVGGRKWVELSYLDFADAVLTAGYLSPADVERAIAAAKAEAWDEGKRVAEELDCEATVSWGRCGVAAWNDRPGLFNPYRTAGPERRTEPDEAVSADD